MLTFEMTLNCLYKRRPLVLYMLPQIICIYTISLSDITKSSKTNYFNSAGHSQNWCGGPKAKQPKILVAQNGH